MEIRKINFEGMKSIRKRCITFAKDGNRVVKPYKEVYSMVDITNNSTHSNLYAEVVSGRDGTDLHLWDCLGNICVSVGRVPGDKSIEDLSQMLDNYPYLGIDGFLDRLKRIKEHGGYINKCDIEVCNMLGKFDIALEYETYREDFLRKREEKAIKEEMDRKALEAQKEAAHKEEIEKKIRDTERAIKNRQPVANVQFENSTIILYLMKRYGIEIPLRTQGWINKALAQVFFDKDGTITYRYYKGSKDSSVFWNYLVELEQRILAGG